MVQKCKEVPAAVSASLAVDADEVSDLMEYALQAGKHSEFHEISTHIGIPRDQVLNKISAVLFREHAQEFSELVGFIQGRLDS